MRYPPVKNDDMGQQKGIILMLADVGRCWQICWTDMLAVGFPLVYSLYEASTYKLCIIPTIKTC